jgi:hypothetical protein
MSMSHAAIISAKIAAIAGTVCVVVAAPAMGATGSVTGNGFGQTVVQPASAADGHPWDRPADGHPWDRPADGHPWDRPGVA